MYISGKITGLYLPDAMRMFEDAEKIVSKYGYEPINPITEVPKNFKFDWYEYMKFDIKILMDCEAIFMLSNWKDSKGAIIEHDLAKKLNYKIIYQEKQNKQNMKVKLIRYNSEDNYTDGMLFIDNKFICYTIEDEHRTKKVWGETRIPEGKYDIVLRKEGRFHNNYISKFKDIHKGMLCITNDSDFKLKNNGLQFQYILFHIGNTDKDTAGCILTGLKANADKNFIGNSTVAYKKFYPIVANELDKGNEVEIEVLDLHNLI